MKGRGGVSRRGVSEGGGGVSEGGKGVSGKGRGEK